MSFSPTLAVLRERAADIRVVKTIGAPRGRINCVAFSPDNRRLAIGGFGAWSFSLRDDERSIRELIPFDTTTNIPNITKVTWITFSPSGKLLAACDFGSIHVWSEEGEISSDRRPSNDPIYNGCAFSPDDKSLAWASDSAFGWFTLDNDKNIHRPVNSRVNTITFSPDGQQLAMGFDNGRVRLFTIGSTALRSTEHVHSGAVNIVAFSKDGYLLASCSNDNTIGIHEAKSGKQIREIKAPGRFVKSLAWSPDGKLLVSRSRESNQGLCVWHWESGELVFSSPQLSTQLDDLWSPRALAISADGKLLATYSAETVEAIELWDISSITHLPSQPRSSGTLRRARVPDNHAPAIDTHLRTLPLTHATPPTPSRPAAWLRGATVIGVRPPLILVQDLGTLIIQSKPQLARPQFLPQDIDTSGYHQFLTRLSTHPLLRQVSTWDVSDSMVGVILARLLEGVEFSEAYASFDPIDVVAFARSLAVELDRADPEKIWRSTDPANRPSINRIFPAEARARVESNLRRLDPDELRFMHRYGPRFAGAPDPRDLLDLFTLINLPPGVQHSLTQMLRLIPRISQCKGSGGAQTYAMGGYAGLTNKGNLDSLVPTELAYPDEVLLYRFLNQEALYYGRETERERSRELVYIVTQAGLDLLGDGDVLARALTLALAQTLQRRGYEVQQSFVGSAWTEPTTMLRPADVQRILYHRDRGPLKAKAMLEAVFQQLRVWSERYQKLLVMWVVGEHWDADDLNSNRDLYNAVAQHAEQQAWFIRIDNGGPGALHRYPPAARQFGRHEIISSALMWTGIAPPERIFVTPESEPRRYEEEPAAEVRFRRPLRRGIGEQSLERIKVV